MSDAVDSHFRYVLSRMQAINPQRQVFGIMEAQDWPPQQVRFESFYLTSVGESPIGRSFDSAAVPVVNVVLQWVWMVLGTDLKTGVVGRNRGDRYRIDSQMKHELRQALYPRFCQKQRWTLTGGQSLSSLQLQPTPTPDGAESIWWSPATFHRSLDKASGMIYGSASIDMTDMHAMIAA